jgi:hypothetical protein
MALAMRPERFGRPWGQSHHAWSQQHSPHCRYLCRAPPVTHVAPVAGCSSNTPTYSRPSRWRSPGDIKAGLHHQGGGRGADRRRDLGQVAGRPASDSVRPTWRQDHDSDPGAGPVARLRSGRLNQARAPGRGGKKNRGRERSRGPGGCRHCPAPPKNLTPL